MAEDKKEARLAILDYTAEEWERYKWKVEREAHERELILKEREDRRSFFKSPLILSIAGALVAFVVNAANETWTKSRNLAQQARESEAGLIQKAMDQDDPGKVIAKLRLLDAAGMIPRHRNQLISLWTDEKAAALFLNAAGADGKSAGAVAAPSQPCAQAQATGNEGWIYLGRASKTAWVPGAKGINQIRFEGAEPQGAGFLNKIKGQCFSVAEVKFLHDDGPSGEKHKAPIKMPVSPSMRMRITDIDEGPPNSNEAHAAIWAHVEVLAN